MINLYSSTETNFTKNGIVILSDALSCKITEELNGAYELELEYPLDDRGKWQNLLENNIIKADGQLFRIYHKIKNLNSIRVNARHIFYDLLDNFLEDVRPTDQSGYGALDWILTHTQYPHNFTSLGDVGGSDTKYYIRKNVVEAIMGSEGIINVWGGEIVRDNFEIKLLGQRGLDRGVLVSYAKNIQGIEETLDLDGLATRIMPLGKDALMLPEKYVDSQYINNFPHPKIRVIEFNNIEDEATLRASGENYFIETKCDIPQFNYKIDFLELSKTEEYKNYAVLERVYLGDTVTIKHSKLNINLKAKVIKIIKNNITNRIEKVELGSFKPNIASAINNSIQDVKDDIVQVKTAYQTAIDNATNLITGSNGGNVVMNKNEAGQINEILIMDTTDKMTAVNVWRWNSGGFGHSSTGYNGPYPTAITQDGHIVASFITALTITASQIIGGTLKLGGLDNASGIFRLVDGLGNYLATMDNTGIKSYYNGGKLANWFNAGGLDFYDWWVAGGNKVGNIYAAGSGGSGGSKGLNFDLNPTYGTFMSFNALGQIMFDIETTRDVKERIIFKQPVKFSTGLQASDDVQISKSIRSPYNNFFYSMLVGDYSESHEASKMIWTMGDDYNTWATQYGIAYECLTSTYADHQIVIKGNGVTKARFSMVTGDIQAEGNCYNGPNGYKCTASENSTNRIHNFLWSSTTNMTVVTQDHGNYGVAWWASDISLKENVRDSINDSLSKIMQIKHREFDYIAGGHSNIGYISQELMEIDKSFAFGVTQEDNTELFQPNISIIIPNITKAIQQLKQTVDSQKAEIDFLKNELALLKETVNLLINK